MLILPKNEFPVWMISKGNFVNLRSALAIINRNPLWTRRFIYGLCFERTGILSNFNGLKPQESMEKSAQKAP
jgi:hypothetical protein